jgi:hypothetical protein
LVVGGLVTLIGYSWAGIRRVERPVSPELVMFYRREQMRRLKEFLVMRGSSAPQQSSRVRTIS